MTGHAAVFERNSSACSRTHQMQSYLARRIALLVRIPQQELLQCEVPAHRSPTATACPSRIRMRSPYTAAGSPLLQFQRNQHII
jgi:hypothetical protein